MKRNLGLLAIAAALLCVTPSAAGAAPAAREGAAPAAREGAAPAAREVAAPTAREGAAPTAGEKIASVRYLVGTWSCTHTVGTFSGSYTTTYASVFDNLWLRQTYDFPPPQAGDPSPGVQGEFIMGYDEPRQAWVRFGAMSTGRYFAIRMTESGDGGWSWKYVSFFKRATPETADSDATFTKRSAVEYAVDGPTYPKDGTMVTEHHVCKKQR